MHASKFGKNVFKCYFLFHIFSFFSINLYVYIYSLEKFIEVVYVQLYVCMRTGQCASQSTANSHEMAQICFNTHWKYLSNFSYSHSRLVSFANVHHIFQTLRYNFFFKRKFNQFVSLIWFNLVEEEWFFGNIRSIHCHSN